MAGGQIRHKHGRSPQQSTAPGSSTIRVRRIGPQPFYRIGRLRQKQTAVDRSQIVKESSPSDKTNPPWTVPTLPRRAAPDLSRGNRSDPRSPNHAMIVSLKNFPTQPPTPIPQYPVPNALRGNRSDLQSSPHAMIVSKKNTTFPEASSFQKGGQAFPYRALLLRAGPRLGFTRVTTTPWTTIVPWNGL